MIPNKGLIIVHETNPRKYFPAIFKLAESGEIKLVGEYRYSVFKEWLRSWIKDRSSFIKRTKNSLKDLSFRLTIPWLRGYNILAGFAPWDWRVLFFLFLAKKNRIIYHTSWHNWDLRKVPNRYSHTIDLALYKLWDRFLHLDNVSVVAHTNVVADAISKEFNIQSTVIPHSVPDFFYRNNIDSKSKHLPIKLIFVGELSEKKGIYKLLSLMEMLPKNSFMLTIIGDGPLRNDCIEADRYYNNITFSGPIYDRYELANILSEQDILLLLSQKIKEWEEVFGIVIIEALAAGLGVITSDHIGPKNIFKDKNLDNLFNENDLDSIKNKLINLYEDPEYLLSFKMEQVEISKKYHIDSVAQKWTNVININSEK